MGKRFNLARIDLAALAHNLGEAKKLVGPKVRIMAVVKADAYGHGMVRAARRLAESGADALGVMDLHEAALLRDHGIDIPVYILAGVEPDQAEEIVARKLNPFIYEAGLAREISLAARRLGGQADISLKVDTGMNRLGATSEGASGFLEEVHKLEQIRVTGLATHFPEADSPETEFTSGQIGRFSELIAMARNMGYHSLSGNSAANSAGVMAHPESHFDLVRPGLMLYGGYPEKHLVHRADLKPVMTVTSRIIQVKRIYPGDSVSYGRTWVAGRVTDLAIVPFGYAHGYHRSLSNKGQALIRGCRAPLRGRVCMNLTAFEVTDIPGAASGDEVVILGAQDGERITAEELGDLSGTINYEVFCHLGGLIEHEYN